MDRRLANVYRVIEVPEWMGREWNKVISIITGLSITLYAEGRLSTAESEEFDSALAWLVEFWLLLTTSKWHLWRRHKLVKKIKSPSQPVDFEQAVSEQTDSLP
jgi:hypothetical protein